MFWLNYILLNHYFSHLLAMNYQINLLSNHFIKPKILNKLNGISEVAKDFIFKDFSFELAKNFRFSPRTILILEAMGELKDLKLLYLFFINSLSLNQALR